jgi:hypothetical protein
MAKQPHCFVETLDGIVGYGLDRQTDENAVQAVLAEIFG